MTDSATRITDVAFETLIRQAIEDRQWVHAELIFLTYGAELERRERVAPDNMLESTETKEIE